MGKTGRDTRIVIAFCRPTTFETVLSYMYSGDADQLMAAIESGSMAHPAFEVPAAVAGAPADTTISLLDVDDEGQHMTSMTAANVTAASDPMHLSPTLIKLWGKIVILSASQSLEIMTLVDLLGPELENDLKHCHAESAFVNFAHVVLFRAGQEVSIQCRQLIVEHIIKHLDNLLATDTFVQSIEHNGAVAVLLLKAAATALSHRREQSIQRPAPDTSQFQFSFNSGQMPVLDDDKPNLKPTTPSLNPKASSFQFGDDIITALRTELAEVTKALQERDGQLAAMKDQLAASECADQAEFEKLQATCTNLEAACADYDETLERMKAELKRTKKLNKDAAVAASAATSEQTDAANARVKHLELKLKEVTAHNSSIMRELNKNATGREQNTNLMVKIDELSKENQDLVAKKDVLLHAQRVAFEHKQAMESRNEQLQKMLNEANAKLAAMSKTTSTAPPSAKKQVTSVSASAPLKENSANITATTSPASKRAPSTVRSTTSSTSTLNPPAFSVSSHVPTFFEKQSLAARTNVASLSPQIQAMPDPAVRKIKAAVSQQRKETSKPESTVVPDDTVRQEMHNLQNRHVALKLRCSELLAENRNLRDHGALAMSKAAPVAGPAPGQPSESRIVRQYNEALRIAGLEFKACNSCFAPFNSMFRGAPEDPKRMYIALKCTSCEAECCRWKL